MPLWSLTVNDLELGLTSVTRDEGVEGWGGEMKGGVGSCTTYTNPTYTNPTPRDCCWGDTTVPHQHIVLSLPWCCTLLTCYNGTIKPDVIGRDATDCCEFDGVMYPNGGRLAAQCVSLECSRGQWIVKDYDDCCAHCSVYNDPHFTTFDGHYYDFHGSCNYSLAQTDTSLSPHTAVYSQFKPCFGHASCLDTVTFRENPHVIVTLEPGVVDSLKVNDELYIVATSGVHVVTTSSGPHPLLVWRDNDCLQILGVSKIMVTHCSNVVDIWTFPTHADNLDGLCGHFNYYVDDDLTSRDGQVTTLTHWPFAFPESWKDPCRPEVRHKYLPRCRRHLHYVIGRDVQLAHFVDNWQPQAPPPHNTCSPGSRWLQDCNWCTCSDSGDNAICTLMACSNDFVPELGDEVCSDGSWWRVDCNWCQCVRGGAICTHNDCNGITLPPPPPPPTSLASQCLLPKDPGPCKASQPRYYYNHYSEQCEHFIYGGCLGNDNNFQTMQECLVTCGFILTGSPTPPTVDPSQCLLPKDAGPCQNFQPRYYYNSHTGHCEYFVYGGCLGNGNNFNTIQECLTTCGTTTNTPVTVTLPPTTSDPSQCLLPKDAGPCQNFQPRYYYNSHTGHCEYFAYGGCLGNGNNFNTIQECLTTCGTTTNTPVTVTLPPTTSDPSQCLLPKDAGPCQNFQPRYYYNSHTGHCEYFAYGGCLGNGNNFNTIQECLTTCGTTTNTPVTVTLPPTTSDPSQCLLPKDAGPCQNFQPRYYYNSHTGHCEYFAYGGCLGNGNNFNTIQECLTTCGNSITTGSTPPPTVDPSQCLLPKDAGPCQNFQPRYYYNSHTGHCEYFVYGGCLGNGNNFNTIQECLATCGSTTNTPVVTPQPSTSDPFQCLLPKDAGPCQNFQPRYYYNSHTGHCEYFAYGGCLGNWNNFNTIQECLEACGNSIPTGTPSATAITQTTSLPGQTSRCLLDSHPGHCNEFIPRFYYNSERRTCEFFIYTGCGGNDNNFGTLETCLEACSAIYWIKPVGVVSTLHSHTSSSIMKNHFAPHRPSYSSHTSTQPNQQLTLPTGSLDYQSYIPSPHLDTSLPFPRSPGSVLI
ncbi:hypothetical protein Pmani_024255 [Petrolisthes manimaculis]|uniref:Uncharacterized protein n=1 Tax=Petrolisthes manimaculis TaxID=1843537 RepID=A0AAE1PAR2_9EUCA|nr:hypothetical protein Pmani_024255 [Petrolisthes manimaculis]